MRPTWHVNSNATLNEIYSVASTSYNVDPKSKILQAWAIDAEYSLNCHACGKNCL